VEWWRNAVLRWAADPPHYFDDDGRGSGVLPIPFPNNATLTADDRIALLAAIYDTCVAGGVRIDPWAIFLLPAGADLSKQGQTAWWALKSRVPTLREHWSSHQAMIEVFLVEVERKLAASATADRTSQQPNAAGDVGSPKQYLLNWREILDALSLPNNEENRGRVRALAELRGGPISLPRKGGQPKVEKTKLIEWWNDLEHRFDESAQRICDRNATVETTHNYGRDATVAPEIQGGVKRRRQTSQKVQKGPETS
jgi:hypothetical protein